MYDDSNLVRLIKEVFEGRSFKRSVIMQAVDLNTGEIVIFDETMDEDMI